MRLDKKTHVSFSFATLMDRKMLPFGCLHTRKAIKHLYYRELISDKAYRWDKVKGKFL